jgi:hypothetical protein
VDEDVFRQAKQRLTRPPTAPADVEAALERARTQVEELAAAAAALEASLPARVGDAVREGVRAESAPVGRQLAEVRGLTGQVVRRLERLETDLSAERHARVDDLALLVDLIASGWRSVSERLDGIERSLDAAERRSGTLRAV